jgi:methionine-rich copper-binding protein CopC
MAILWDNISLSVRKLDKTQLSRLQSTAENSSDEAVLITLSPKNTLIESFDAFASVFQRSQSNLLEFQPLSKQISFDPSGVSHSFLVQISPDEKAAFQLRLAGVSELSLDDTILNIVFLDNEKYIVYEDSQTETANLSKQFLKIPHLLTEVIPDLESNALEEVNLLDIEAFQDIPVSNIINFQNEIDATETVSLSLSDTANSSVAENVAYSAAAPTLTGTPIGDVTYSLSGDDASLFSVATDGAVSMVGRDFENPADTGSNNTYSYTLIATDEDGNTASDGVTVTITDATETVSLSLSDTANSSVAENVAYSAAAPTLTGTPIGDVTYSLSGDDASLFSVATDGAVSMVGRDFENPADTGSNNTYSYTLIATDDDGNTASDGVTVTITDATLAMSDTANSSVAENVAYSASAPTITGAPMGTVTYSLAGSDASLFSVAADGAVSMAGQDFENPADTSDDNVYHYTLIAQDEEVNAAYDQVYVTVTDAIEGDTTAPTVSSFSSTTSNGSYNAGDRINITATTSESVQAGNTITVTLDTGETVVLTATSAGTTLTGTYEVGAGDTSSDLTVSSFSIGTVEDTAGNAMTSTTVPSSNNIADNSAIVVDTSAPTLSSSSPADDATAVAVGSNIVLNFSEAVDVDSGDIVIYKASDNSVIETIAVGSSKVTGTGTTQITINPSSDLASSTEYYVQIAATGFDDTAGNSYAGITDTTSLSFTTADIVAPTLSSSSPADDATAVAVGSNIVLNFSEAVDVDSGDIVIYKASDNSVIETIAVGSSKVTGTGTTQITINPSSDLASSTEYYVQIAATGFDDTAGNSYAGITDTTSLSFTTAPTLSIDDVSYTESSSAGNATFIVTLSEASGQDVTVDYASSDVSATAGSDYTATSGTVTIAAGNTTATINVPILVDTLDESNETATVTLSNASNASISDATGTLTIVDDDAAPTLSIDDVSYTESSSAGNATFTVTLSEVSGKDVTVDYASSDVSATAGSDYTAISGTVTIPAGNTTASINVPILVDTLDESNETARVTLSDPTNATIASVPVDKLPTVEATQIGSDIDGEDASDESGRSVSLSSDGSIVAIGAYYNGGNGTNSGHVRIYENDSGTWEQMGSDIDGEAADNVSGYSVSLSSNGSIVAIGARGNDENGTDRGHVRIYQYNSGTNNWSQIGSDIDGEAAGDKSGHSVSLSSDGSTVAIGALRNDGNSVNNSGHVRIYQNNSGTWSQIGSDIDGEAAGNESGTSVSLSSDGSIVAIGATGNDENGTDSGHVRIYENNSGTWSQIGLDIDGEAAGDVSGTSVSLSSDGSIVAIGATGNDGNGFNSGHVRIYQNNSGTWSQIGSDIDGDVANDYFGTSVSLSSDGSIVAIGSANNDGNGSNSGHVRIYQNNSGTWSQIGSDIDGEAAGDKSGTSVSLSSDGSTIAIGAHYNDGNGSNSGHVRVFDTGLYADTGTLTIIDDDGDTTASAATLTISTSGFSGATTTSVPSGASGLNAIVEDNLNSAINGTSSADYIEIQDTPNSNAGSISGGNGDDIIYIKGWSSNTSGTSVDGSGGSDTLYINPSIFSSKSNWTNNGGIISGTIHFTNGGSIIINNFEAVNGIWGGAGGQFERNISVTATLNDTDGSESLSDITVSNLPDNTTVKDSDGNAVTVSSNAFTVDSVVSGTAQVFTLTKAGPFDFTASGAVTVTESNGGATTTTSSSVLIDGVVEGVEYFTTSGMSGLTNQEGLFNYQDGDDITFKVGGVVLGTATAEDVTSGRTFLQDIADVERSNLSDDYLENMAVFLQSLDENHDSNDGIVITDDTRLALQNVDFDLREANEEELQHLIEQIGGQYVNEADAMKHVKDMLIQHADMTETDFDKSGLSVVDADTSNEPLTVNTVDLSAIQAVETARNPASINTIDAESIDFKNILDTGGGALELNAIVNQAVHATQISEKDFNTPEISELPALKVEEIGPTFDNKHAQDDARDFQEQFTVYV